MMTPLEIKGLMAAVVTSAVVLIATFTAGGIYRNRFEMETQPGTKSLAPENLAARGRSFFFQSCAHCHGRDADGGRMRFGDRSRDDLCRARVAVLGFSQCYPASTTGRA